MLTREVTRLCVVGALYVFISLQAMEHHGMSFTERWEHRVIGQHCPPKHDTAPCVLVLSSAHFNLNDARGQCVHHQTTSNAPPPRLQDDSQYGTARLREIASLGPARHKASCEACELAQSSASDALVRIRIRAGVYLYMQDATTSEQVPLEPIQGSALMISRQDMHRIFFESTTLVAKRTRTENIAKPLQGCLCAAARHGHDDRFQRSCFAYRTARTRRDDCCRSRRRPLNVPEPDDDVIWLTAMPSSLHAFEKPRMGWPTSGPLRHSPCPPIQKSILKATLAGHAPKFASARNCTEMSACGAAPGHCILGPPSSSQERFAVSTIEDAVSL
ncbi:uncharacterized protein MYCFIDRAFT_169285 [Pseudocercospora fijiensis CIRAD86]|uniref:Uncharacterized protein n=1 Tax=Pseudocercospora fijiensis (strain CIRAD86) TaxID=383855 RepID=N1Q5Y1_PSEFD|nr:uncharacterized protein MYCFIDRAFT_169285 [Pseudocercospora fijiensis CIRAD86]EME87469.1 hypothetical protein MYCFIDRAFT_169285 [Pseudocercospora fijiensis CIRAD86]